MGDSEVGPVDQTKWEEGRALKYSVKTVYFNLQ